MAPQLLTADHDVSNHALITQQGCAFKSHGSEIWELPKGWKKLLTSHRKVLEDKECLY